MRYRRRDFQGARTWGGGRLPVCAVAKLPGIGRGIGCRGVDEFPRYQRPPLEDFGWGLKEVGVSESAR
jgi:hypothetical protein